MGGRSARVVAAVLAGFIAMSAAAGAVGLVGGGLTFPPEWLVGTPFTSYTVPGLILGLVVGGSALAAALLLVAEHRWAVPAAFGAGAIQVGWIAGEVLLVGTRGGVMLAMQATWLAAGLALALVSAGLWARRGAGSAA